MNKWLVLPLSLCLTAGVSLTAQAAGDAAAGKTKAVTCVACHGPDGNSMNPIWPKLAGQHPRYIKKQLQQFKSGARQDPLMASLAQPLSDQDMDDLAAYFSSQTQQGGEAAADAVALGERLYRGGVPAKGLAACMACHGPQGLGVGSAQFPRIGGQHAAYVEKTLKDFRAKARTNDMNEMMRGVAAQMTDAEIAAVAQYVQGLH